MDFVINHELDVRQDFFSGILSGKKKHEVRKANEVNFKEGDFLQLKEIDFFTGKHTGRELTVEATYITPINIGEIYSFAIISINVIEGKNI